MEAQRGRTTNWAILSEGRLGESFSATSLAKEDLFPQLIVASRSQLTRPLPRVTLPVKAASGSNACVAFLMQHTLPLANQIDLFGAYFTCGIPISLAF